MNRFSRILAFVALVLSIVGVVYCVVARQSSIHYAFINTEKMLGTIADAQQVSKELLREEEKWNKAKRQMEDSLQAFESLMSIQYDTASVKTKKALKAEQIHRIEELGRFEKAKTDGLQKMQVELMTPVYKRINEALAEYAKAHGLDIVFASSNGSIVYGEGAKADITADFVKFFNSRLQ